MLPNYNHPRSRTNLFGGLGPGTHNHGALPFPPPGAQFVERTRDPRVANRGTKRENDESHDGMFFHWLTARTIEAEGEPIDI